MYKDTSILNIMRNLTLRYIKTVIENRYLTYFLQLTYFRIIKTDKKIAPPL